MRIVGGTLRGLKLADVGDGDNAAHLRPTTDRVREAIFNLLVNGAQGNPIPGARVLDLFAGTGALGLEALSRGAGHAVFVDDGTSAQALIRSNIARARAGNATASLRRDATRLGDNREAPHGLVFLDPPYGQGLGERAIASALDGGWIAPGAVVVWEERRPPVVAAPLVPFDQRRYGDTVVTLARMPGS
ncbi:16S rRNA (guanine(966)-N(2))-methyltransferase RsmD [Paracoccus sediminis]|uniref:16S rRNA (Guanine(966)-N(2))-methyltransferase RsmD n=1 Tax=Paracoccus sediminis TaxID=1214787 RepID=A0A238VWH9_9RHOB|nr:16S rRNA (guanine(966)-N(2))-methyltransferase RsmD [Paracoccus sediminis]TBN51349.1 16S rRNA (guanine(966)-N(2))-methyltransferase RsmD [Paracoccus sediminis]SNR38497.1 16S rRNA (guanine966-N2)-methyltransferase [Paracoccus sediminis]